MQSTRPREKLFRVTRQAESILKRRQEVDWLLCFPRAIRMFVRDFTKLEIKPITEALRTVDLMLLDVYWLYARILYHMA